MALKTLGLAESFNSEPTDEELSGQPLQFRV